MSGPSRKKRNKEFVTEKHSQKQKEEKVLFSRMIRESDSAWHEATENFLFIKGQPSIPPQHHISCHFEVVLLRGLAAFDMESSRENGNGKQKIVEIGLWGGHGGSSWDDRYYDGVREITIAFGHCIDSIQVVYDKNGSAVVAEKHGGVGGSRTAEIKLQWPDEYITCISGHYFPIVPGGTPVIRSITIKSNKRMFGPFGVEEGMPFILPLEGLHIVGLKGRGGWFLDAIGFHVTRARPTKMLQRVHKTFRRLANTTA